MGIKELGEFFFYIGLQNKLNGCCHLAYSGQIDKVYAKPPSNLPILMWPALYCHTDQSMIKVCNKK